MATEKQIEILTKLKEKLSYRLNNVRPEEINPENEYIWVGGQNGLVGNLTCHYEFIFQDDETLNLEVHFEEKKNCEEFKDVLSKKYKTTLEFADWEKKHKRIIGKNDNYHIKINENVGIDKIVNRAIELLEELDNSIGYSLAKKCDELKPKASLSKKSGKVVDEKEYKKRFINYKKSFHTKHGSIQKALVKKIKKDYDNCRTEIKLDDNSIRVDVLGIKKNGKTDEKEYTYDIYEVKPYDSPTECIREALGQLLYYKYQFEKNGYIVGRLIVVGQNKLGFFDRQYLEKIQKSLPKVDYITP